MIAQSGPLKLVGHSGPDGSTAYYQAMTVIGINASDTVMQDIGWHSNSELIGANGPAYIAPGQMPPSYGTAGFYNITDVARNNGTITLTNAAKDQYGDMYDLHLQFANAGVPDTGNEEDPTNLVIGPSSDGSIEFDGYGGFMVNNVKIGNLYFTKHGSMTPSSVNVISTFGDLDNHQFIDTSLGNALSYVPSNSEVSQSGSTFNGAGPEDDGYNSTPRGTFLMVGQGSHFNVEFGWMSDTRPSLDNFKNISASHQETGFQFNLFGPSATSKVLIPPVRKTSSVNYHYDTPSTFSLLYFRLLVNNNL